MQGNLRNIIKRKKDEQMNNNSKGTGFLFIMSIVMIAAGALDLLGSINIVRGIGALAGSGGSSALLWIGGILLLAGSAVQIWSGVKGLTCKNAPAKAGGCFTWGIICAVVLTAGTLLYAAGGAGLEITSIVLGTIIPVIFAIAASSAKKAA